MKKLFAFSVLVAGLMLQNACSASLNLMKGGVLKGNRADDIQVITSGIYDYPGFWKEIQIQDEAAVNFPDPAEIETADIHVENIVEPDHFYDPESFRHPSGVVGAGEIAVYILIKSVPLW